MSEPTKQNHQSNGNLGTIAIQNKTTLWQDNLGLSSEAATRKLISHYNKPLFEYYLNLTNTDLEVPPELESNPDEPPPFLVVGLGRCGCHVTAELAEIIACNSARSDDNPQKDREKGRKMLDLFRSGKSGTRTQI